MLKSQLTKGMASLIVSSPIINSFGVDILWPRIKFFVFSNIIRLFDSLNLDQKPRGSLLCCFLLFMTWRPQSQWAFIDLMCFKPCHTPKLRSVCIQNKLRNNSPALNSSSLPALFSVYLVVWSLSYNQFRYLCTCFNSMV